MASFSCQVLTHVLCLVGLKITLLLSLRTALIAEINKSPKLICFSKIFSGVVGHNPKKSGKFLSAPLIFSFPYAHGWKGQLVA